MHIDRTIKFYKYTYIYDIQNSCLDYSPILYVHHSLVKGKNLVPERFPANNVRI